MTAKEVKAVFWYHSGSLYRHHDALSRLKPGRTLADIAGFNPIKSRTTIFNGARCQVHRLIWIYHNGSISPGLKIIHKNGNKSDNRIRNLAIADHSSVIKSAGRTKAQDKAFLEHCQVPLKSKVPGLYSDGNLEYIKMPSGARRYISYRNYDACMEYLGR